MSIFRGCPHRWKLQYKDKIKRFNSSIHTVFGTAIHESIQYYLDVMYEKSGAAADRLDIEEDFKHRFRSEYLKQYKANNNAHFSDANEMREFFEDGIGIINWLKKKRSWFFKRKGWYLVGCELPIVIAPNKRLSNVLYTGYLDVVLYNENTETFKIIDIKSSTKGWNKFAKADDKKIFQLLLYKEFFAKQFNIPIEKVNVEYFIVKRRVPVEADFASMQRRVQEFRPTAGKIKRGKALSAMNNFIKDVLDENNNYIDKSYYCTGDRNPCWHCNVYDGVLEK